MTTVRFLMRWFYKKSSQRKLRAEVGSELTAKPMSARVTKVEPPDPEIKWANMIRWHF